METLAIVWDMLSYIFSIELHQIPLHVAYFGVAAMVGYCAAMILIGVPCSIWESITKKKVPSEAENKAISVVAVCFTIVLLVRVLYEKVS